MRPRLVIRPPIEHGEGPRGYYLRVAEANQLSTQTLAVLGWKFNAETLALLAADAVGCDDAASRRYRHMLGRLLDEQPAIWNSNWARFCPRCLAEDKIWRAEWELKFVDACPSHGVWLVDVCGSCGKPLTWNRVSLTHCTCGTPLSRATSLPAPERVAWLATVLHSRFLEIPVLTDSPVTRPLSLSQLQRLIRLFGAYGDLTPRPNRMKILNEAQMRNSWQITSVAAELLGDWPRAFNFILDLMQKQGHKTDRRFQSCFGQLYRYIYKDLGEPEFAPIRESFEKFISERWYGPLARRNRRLSESVWKEAAWVPANHARRMLGVSSRRLDDLVISGDLRREQHTSVTGRSFLMFYRPDLERLSSRVRSEFSLKAIVQELGLPKHRARRLLVGLFPQIRRAEMRGRPWAIPKEGVERLLAVGRELPRLDDVPRDSLCFGTSLEVHAWKSEDFGAFMEEVLGGQILPHAYLRRESGIAGWVFERRVLTQWERQRQPMSHRHMSIPDAAIRLRIKEEVAYFLVRHEFLRAPRFSRRPGSPRRVWNEDIKTFEATFEFGTTAAGRIGTSPRSLMQKLAALEVYPVSGPGIDGGRQALYRRTKEYEHAVHKIEHARNGYAKPRASASIREGEDD